MVNIEQDKITLLCEGCGKKLMNIVLVPGNNKHMVQATCPFCSVGSEIKTLNGSMFISPIVKEESRFPTIIEDVDFLDTKQLFKIAKDVK